jgi:DNA polymerase I
MFVRQLEFENSEADDLIAYYCQISKGEDKTIFSGDRDLTQLISDDVTIYSPNTKKYYKKGDNIKLHEIEIPHYNVKTFKIVSGDKSDNIDGIYYLGEKTFVKLFPEILEREVSFTDILTRGEELLKRTKRQYSFKKSFNGENKRRYIWR